MIDWEGTSDDFRKAFGTQTFRAGFLKLCILKILTEKPLHGYALIREIQKITGSSWKPSPGSVYPALQSLQENGLVVLRASGRNRTFEITELGEEMLAHAVVQVQAGLHNLQNLLEYQYKGE